MKLLRQQDGFSLIEVMIALAIFAVFITSFMAGQGYNITDSAGFRTELKLKELAINKLNEIIVDPPEFTKQLTLTPDKGKFENDETFEWQLEYTEFLIPNINEIQGKEEEEDDNANALQKKIFENVKKNLEKMIWQVRITVTDTNTNDSYSVSTWLMNDKHEAQIDAL